MSFFSKIKSILKGPAQEEFKTSLPSIIQVNVNPKDSWDIIGELGDGAFGKVEKAVSRSNRNQLAAAKAIEVQDGESLEDFLVEIEILTGCKHINIVDLYAAYFYDNKLHMMLELCGGGAIDGIMIELEKGLTEPQIAYIAKYTNEALIFLHEKSVIHRDLKAGNILLTSDGIVKLADFGVSAKLKDRNERRDTFIGTPYWMAPEVMMCETFKDQPYTTISDIWSFGITLIEMAQMEPPHSNVSPMRVLIKVQKSEPPTLDRPSIWSIYFNDFLSQCLIKDPSKRRNAQELTSHPFIRDATDKKPIMALMAEVNAEIQEEVIVDDERSVDGSLPESEDPDDGSWAIRKPNPVPVAFEAFKKSDPVPSPVVEISESPKKRVAPPPPQPESYQLPKAMAIENHEKSLSPHCSEQQTNSSPRREAMDVLDDLNGVLDGEDKDDYFGVPSSSGAKEPWMIAPSSPSPSNKSRSSPDNSIKRVIQAAKEVKTSDSPVLRDTPSSVVSENITASFHNNEVHIRIDDSLSQNSFARTQLAISPALRKDSVSSTSSQSRPSSRLMKDPSPTAELQEVAEKPIEIPEGHVKNKIKQVIEEQATVNESFEAKKLAQERREADAVLFKTPAVAKIAASFQTSTVEKDQNYNNTVEASPTTTKKAMVPPPQQQLRSNNEQAPEKHNYFNAAATNEPKAPPPEPPVDYEKKLEHKENNPPVVLEEKVLPVADEIPVIPVEAPKPPRPQKVPGEPRVGARKNPARQTITKKTRTYVIDGMQVTSTTMHVLGAKEDMQLRKQQLQDLRRLQREEARQKQELQAEGMALAEQQERKFQQEKFNLARQCELDMEALERKQKREIEEAERMQEEELRHAQKRIKIEQEKDVRAFKERKKQEMKIVKQEMDLLPRSQRKEAMKIKKEHLEHENHMMEADFLMQLQKNADATLARLAQKHKERIAQLERQFLMQKHLLLRAKENNEWELEEKQMGEKYVLHRKLFKDEYFLLRTQMLARHQKELAQAMKIHQDEEEELIRALALDRKKLPKVLRQEAKTRSAMFKESLRIGTNSSMSNSEINEKVRRFEDQENTRARHALEEHDSKSARKVAMLKERHAQAMRELEEMQNEKKKQLLEKERVTMQEHEKKYFEMREQWQSDLAPRKMMLESKFQEELESQERFYGVALHAPLASTSVVPPRFN